MRPTRTALTALTLALAGCGSLDGATTRAYGKCRASLVDQGLSDDASRAYCVTATQAAAAVELVGEASYEAAGDGVAFRGRLTNPSTQHVVTGFSVKVEHKADGKENLFRVERTWIEPGASFEFTVPQSGMAYAPPPNRRANPAPDGVRWSWDVVDVKGILILP